MERRLIIAVVLSLAILFLWNVVINPPPPPDPNQQKAAPVTPQAEQKPAQQVAPGTADAPIERAAEMLPAIDEPAVAPEEADTVAEKPLATGTENADKAEADAQPAETQIEPVKEPEKPYVRPEEKTAVIETDEFRAVFTTYGGSLKSFVLKSEKFAHKIKGSEETEQLDLVKDKTEENLPYRLYFDRANFSYDINPTYELVASDAKSVTFSITSREGVTIEKKFTHNEGYLFDLNIKVTNGARGVVKQAPYLAITSYQDESELQGGLFGSSPMNSQMPKALIDGEIWSETDKEDLANTIIKKGSIPWAGIDSLYFFTAILPPADAHSQIDVKDIATKYQTVDGQESTKHHLRIMHSLPEDNILEGTSKEYGYRIYIGTKESEYLSLANCRMEDSIDFWHLGFLAKPMLWIMKKSYSFVGNWGVAIIILTLLVKIILYPLNQKSFKSMQKMKDLKPKLDALKQKCGDDKAELNKQMMEMYKREGVNPMGGCLPMLLQMPVFIALYQMLRNAVDLYNSPFIPGWIDNLVQPDPFYVLPTVLALVMFIQQKMTPNPDSQQQKMMMFMMPAMMFFFMLVLPAGLVLYIFANSLLTIGQQWIINKQSQKKTA